MKNILNIVIAADENYLPYATICIKSLFVNNHEFEHIKIHLLGNNLTTKSIQKFTTIFKYPNYNFCLYSISDIEARLQISVPKTIAITSYARLFIASMLPNNIDRILYVDCDVIFNGSIFQFYNTNLGNNLVGGILDTFMNTKAKDLIEIPSNEPYINAGVLLIPLKKWREENLEAKFLNFLLKHEGNVYHHDQGIINAVCMGRKMIFPPIYNASSFYFSHPYRVLAKRNTPFYSCKEVKEARRNPVIIHYTCGYLNRPWIKNCKHPLAYLFYKYKQETIFASLPIQEDKRSARERLDSFIFRKAPFFMFQLYSKIADNFGRLKSKL